MKEGPYENKVLEVGDSIFCAGIKATIADITFQEYWGDDKLLEWGFYTEFRDTNGVYRNWKQMYDGGYVIPKPTEKNMSTKAENKINDIQSPDKAVSIADMYEYGYGWSGMLPLTQSRAEELYRQDIPIYRLYPDGTEGMVENVKELMHHDGLFGVEKVAWEKIIDCRNSNLAETNFKTMCDSLKTKEKDIHIVR